MACWYLLRCVELGAVCGYTKLFPVIARGSPSSPVVHKNLVDERPVRNQGRGTVLYPDERQNKNEIETLGCQLGVEVGLE